jgi:hypothetical protein
LLAVEADALVSWHSAGCMGCMYWHLYSPTTAANTESKRMMDVSYVRKITTHHLKMGIMSNIQIMAAYITDI